MEISKAQVEKILKTLPIGYYIKRDVKTSLGDDKCSYYNIMNDEIVISFEQLQETLKNVNDVENIENYIKRLQKLEEIATSFDGVEKSYAIQAGREIRIMVKPEQVNDDQMVLVARGIVKKIESELEYPGQIKINVIRESRAIDYAK